MGLIGCFGLLLYLLVHFELIAERTCEVIAKGTYHNTKARHNTKRDHLEARSGREKDWLVVDERQVVDGWTCMQ